MNLRVCSESKYTENIKAWENYQSVIHNIRQNIIPAVVVPQSVITYSHKIFQSR